MNMLSSFINSYTDAQLEAEKRELPPLYTVHEAWTNDVAFMNENGISREAARPPVPRKAQRSLEQTAEEEFEAPDHERERVPTGFVQVVAERSAVRESNSCVWPGPAKQTVPAWRLKTHASIFAAVLV